jgi:hypothetical protein
MLPKQGTGLAIGKRNKARHQYRVSKIMGILLMVGGAALSLLRQ